ncbi:MAG: ABC transporter substrate-binding protein [Caulobacteraceae bacterium]
MKDIASLDMNGQEEIVAYREDEEEFVFLDESGNVTREFKIDLEGRICFDVDGSGNIHVLCQEITRNDSNEVTAIKRVLALYDSQGKRFEGEAVTKDIIKGNAAIRDEIIRKLLVDDKGNIFALKLDSSIEIFDKKLDSINTLNKNRYRDMALGENDNLIVSSWSQGRENTIETLDWQSGKILWKKEYASLDAPWKLYYNKTTGKLCGLNEKSIICYGKAGEEKKVLLDYTGISVVEQPESFVVNDKEEIYLVAINQEALKLIKYIKSDKKASSNEAAKKELVFEVFIDIDNTVSNAAREFEKKHPDVKVNVVDTRDFPYDEYKKKMSTELLTGKGADIYCGYSGAVNDYIDKGLLVNFDALIKDDKEFKINDYNASIMNGSRYKGGFYTIPLTYSFDCFLVNDKLLKENGVVVDDNWTWKDFYDIVKKIQSSKPEGKYYAMPKIYPWIVLDSMVYGDIDYYVDRENKKARFDTTEFIDTLKLYQALQKEGMMHPEMQGLTIINSLGSINVESIMFIPITFEYYDQISYFGKCFNDSFRILPMPKGEHSNIREFVGKNIFVNNNSKYKKEAWEFIKYLLSEEVQSRLGTLGGYILHNKVEDKMFKEIFGYQSKNIKIWDYKISEADVAQIKHMTTDILNYNRTSGELRSIIWQELEPFMKNEKSAEETAKALQNKVELYLRE